MNAKFILGESLAPSESTRIGKEMRGITYILSIRCAKTGQEFLFCVGSCNHTRVISCKIIVISIVDGTLVTWWVLSGHSISLILAVNTFIVATTRQSAVEHILTVGIKHACLAVVDLVWPQLASDDFVARFLLCIRVEQIVPFSISLSHLLGTSKMLVNVASPIHIVLRIEVVLILIFHLIITI